MVLSDDPEAINLPFLEYDTALTYDLCSVRVAHYPLKSDSPASNIYGSSLTTNDAFLSINS